MTPVFTLSATTLPRNDHGNGGGTKAAITSSLPATPMKAVSLNTTAELVTNDIDEGSTCVDQTRFPVFLSTAKTRAGLGTGWPGKPNDFPAWLPRISKLPATAGVARA